MASTFASGSGTTLSLPARILDAKTVPCAILYVDVRGSTAETQSAIYSPNTVSERILRLEQASRELIVAHAIAPGFVKSTGDGIMCVWELAIPAEAREMRERIARAALAINADLSNLLTQNWDGKRPMIGLGLAYGDLTRVNNSVFNDYFGFAANLASKLQDAARPSGLVVHKEYFTGLNLVSFAELREQTIDRGSSLGQLQIHQCMLTSDVVLSHEWTCLAWPGFTSSSLDKASNLNGGTCQRV
jgi:class 3 adenylate cyclase